MNFDEIIREKLNQVMGPNNPNAWSDFEKSLDHGTTPTSFNTPLIGGIAATVALGVLFTSLPDIKSERMDLVVNIEVVDDISLSVVESQDLATVSMGDFEPQEVHTIALKPIEKEAEVLTHEGSKAIEASNSEDKSTNVETEKTQHAQTGSIAASVSDKRVDFKAKGIQCANSDVRFTADLDEAATVTWIIDAVHVKDGLQCSHAFNTSGDYTVRMIATFEDGSEIGLSKTIEIFDTPTSEFSVERSKNADCFNTETNLTATPGTNHYKWVIDGDTMGKGSELSVMLDKGLHNIGLLTVNEERCSHFEPRSITIEDDGLKVFVPTAFSPWNNDNSNDAWKPIGLEQAASYQIKIVRNTTNQVVFESTDKVEWDGSIMGSSERPSSGESFSCLITATDRCGQVQQIKKGITLL